MSKYFKNKKMLRKKELIKYLFIIVVLYYTLKISIYFLINTKTLNYIYSQDKLNTYIDLLSQNTFNKPLNFLNIKKIPKQKTNTENNIENNDVVVEIIPKNNKKVYIYNSHPLETYSDNLTTVKSIDNVFLNSFNNIGINVDIEQGDINEFLAINNLDYGYSYVASRYYIESNILNNDYDLIIDLHRDAVNHDVSTININGSDCAKIMFVVGGLNDNYQANLDLANQLNDLINTKYPYLSRGVMLKSGPGVNGLYNQDLSSKMILLELGGNNNSVSEVNNTINLIIPIIGDYINGNQGI